MDAVFISPGRQIGPFRHAAKHLPLALQSSIPS